MLDFFIEKMDVLCLSVPCIGNSYADRIGIGKPTKKPHQLRPVAPMVRTMKHIGKQMKANNEFVKKHNENRFVIDFNILKTFEPVEKVLFAAFVF